MKNLILTIGIITAIAFSTQAQDVIVQTDGTITTAKVEEITDYKIKYKKFNNLEGPSYTIYKADVAKIQFENGTTEVFQKTTASTPQTNTNSPSKEGKLPEFTQTIYLEILGTSGIAGVNYMKQITKSEKSPISTYGRIGLGFSNRAVYVPHSFIVAVGNKNHKVEFGLGGTAVLKFDGDDAFNFLYGDKSKWAFTPSLGYRFQSDNGMYISASMPLILSKDCYGLNGCGTYEYQQAGVDQWGNPDMRYTWVEGDPSWGITPWMSFGVGYSF